MLQCCNAATVAHIYKVEQSQKGAVMRNQVLSVLHFQVCDPLDGGTVEIIDNKIHLKGYAFSGAGAKVNIPLLIINVIYL